MLTQPSTLFQLYCCDKCTYPYFPVILPGILPVLRAIFFPSYLLLSHTTIVKRMDSGERGMIPVTMTIINPWKEYWLSLGSNQQPPILKSCTLPTELWDSSQKMEVVL